ncbi:MAG TPA: DUF885 domain-containing protein [Candidatus Limnocylindria bacterium]|nr:DUF885 domain-containing protein [Candidatus Limnocylindria bacterium]
MATPSFRWQFALALAFLFSSCARPRVSPDAAFNRLADEYLAGYFAWRPAFGMSLGLHEYDGRITDYSRASMDAELLRLKEFDAKLARIHIKKLTREAAFDYRLLQANIRNEIFGFEQMRPYTRNPMTYAGAIDLTQYVKRDFAPLANRLRSIIAIEKQTPILFSAARANLDRVLPKPFVETAIDIAEGQIAFLEKDLPLAVKEVKDDALLAEFRAANRITLTEISNFVAWLKRERLPKADQSFALGREKYREMMRLTEFVELSPEQILELGLRELKAEQKRFADAARTIDPNQPAHDVFKTIQKDHPTPEGLIPDTKKNLEAIREFVVARNIVTIPSDVRVRVEETPPPFRRTSFASMDAPGVFETKATESYYYVTPTEPEWPEKQKDEWLTAFNYYTTDIVTIHEAYPGHYVQFLALKDSGATRLSKIFSSYAFGEGWAHYTEQMLLDAGFPPRGAKPSREDELRAARYRLAQSDEALLRLCRLCVSVKLHTQNMSVEDATKFFMDNCYYEEKTARQEAVRGTFDPGYLNYTLGKLMILKLRADWQAQQGARYTLQNFHDELLRHGAPPLPLLRERMLRDAKRWPDIL